MNPARNAYELVRVKSLAECKRCHRRNLAWVKLASGKWALTETTHMRPVYSGDNQHPEAPNGYVYANKLRFHRCGENELLETRSAVSSTIVEAQRDAITVRADMAADALQDAAALLGKFRRIKQQADSAVDFFFAEVCQGKAGR